jgi:hypothetical protein
MFAPSPFGGRLGWGLAGGSQFSGDDRQNSIKVQEWLVGCETQDRKAMATKKLISDGVVFNLVRMLRAVEFDDQFGRKAGEIRDVIAQRMLSAKLDTQLLHTQT